MLRPRVPVVAWIVAGALLAGWVGASPGPDRVVVLPVQDLTGTTGPIDTVDALIRGRLAEAGFEVVDPAEVLEFLRARRVRYTGGANHATLVALRQDLGAEAVVAGSLDLYVDQGFPRSAVSLRMIGTNDFRLVGAAEVATAGEQAPGILGLGEQKNSAALLAQVVRDAVDDLVWQVRNPYARGVWRHRPSNDRHRPKRLFRAEVLDEPRERLPTVAVVPFENPSGHADAGDLVAGMFVTHLAGRPRFDVIEPGEVRERLLEGRIVQLEGLSLAQSDLLRELLDADYAVTGRVLEYYEAGEGIEPRVTFALWVLDTRRREVVWSAYAANRGGDRVLWFDAGRVYTARSLASAMAAAAADAFERGKPTRPR